MIEDTTLIILDEPSEGVQPKNIEHMAACLQERADADAGVLLVEQNIILGAVLDNHKWGYHGTHEKESFKQT